MSRNVLALDFGTTEGRAVLCTYDGNRMMLNTVHRFVNNPLKLGDTLYWDITNIFMQMRHGIKAAYAAGGLDSIGVDTWGTDFGMIGRDGNILEAPVHYRDKRTADVFDYAFEDISPDELYDITGNRIRKINTLFQLMTLIKDRGRMLQLTEKILLMPDLMNYVLTGQAFAEVSSASVTQLMDIRRRCWSDEIMEKTGIPRRFFPDVIPSGTVIGNLSNNLCTELGVPQSRVIAVCGHDTQCAAAAVPAIGSEVLYIVCGSRSRIGTVTDTPVINETAHGMGLTNEIGYGGKVHFLKSIKSLWLIQEACRQWSKEGVALGHSETVMMALKSKPFRCFIDPDDPVFAPPGNIPRRIREYCKNTGQYVPEKKSEILRCIYESIAFSFRKAYDDIHYCTRRVYRRIYMVGAGSGSELLCRMTAAACGCEVSAGPYHAAAFGNAAIQLVTLGDISSFGQVSRIISASENVRLFKPEEPEKWEKEYRRYRKITDK